MKLSKKGRYAVTAMMELALNANKGPMPLANISLGSEISMSYLEQLFASLRNHGLVKGTRGPGGGYRLARLPEQITIAEILKAVDNNVDTVSTDEQHPVNLSYTLWNSLSERIYDFLNELTLGEFIKGAGYPDVSAPAQKKSGARSKESKDVANEQLATLS